MLSAILNGKGRCLPSTIAARDSLRKAFVRSEDILTSTVFERLAYLEGPVLWQILGATFQPSVLPPRTVVDLIEIEFWPTWGQARVTLGKAVEPDVVLRLSAGDPAQTWVLIIECKLGGIQSHSQWAQEWIAHTAECVASERPDEVRLLALGGLLPAGPEATVSRFSDHVRNDHGIDLKVAVAEWPDLLRVLNEIEIPSATGRRIVADIKQALDLHGFRQVQPMSELADIAAGYRLGWKSDGALRWQYEAVGSTGIDDLSTWAEKTAPFRPILGHHVIKWVDKDVR